MASTAATQPRVSESFRDRASDADIIFKSHDNVLFHIHRKNLESNADGFSPYITGDNDTVLLTEDSSTLNMLFQYMYDFGKEPVIEQLPFGEFYKLAEACEKYKVYYPQILCNERMKGLKDQYPAEALNFATKYDSELVQPVSQILLDQPLDKAVTKLLPHLVLPWVRYRESWSRVIFSVLSSSVACPLRCPKSPTAVPNAAEIWFKLGERRSRKAVYELMSKLECECGANLIHREFAPLVLRQILEQDMDEIPGFKYFMTS